MSKCLVLFVEGDTEVEFYKQVIANARKLHPVGRFDTSIEYRNVRGVGGFKSIALRKFTKEIKKKYDDNCEFTIVLCSDTDVFDFAPKPPIKWDEVKKELLDNGASKIIHVQARRSIEDWFLYDLEGILGFLMLLAWDIQDMAYVSIVSANDYRKEIMTREKAGTVVNLYRGYENEHSNSEYIKDAKLPDIFKFMMGMTYEQFKYQNLAWTYQSFSRNYHILLGSRKISRDEIVDINEITEELFGMSADEFMTNVLYLLWLCSERPDPLGAEDDLYKHGANSILTKENLEKIINYYSVTYDDVRKSPIQKQLFYSKPFVITQKNKEPIMVSMYLVQMLFADGLYWLIRDYYYKNGKGTGFINAFGSMFEEYFMELAEIYLTEDMWHKISEQDKKSADFFVEFEDAVFLFELKSGLLGIKAKQQAPDVQQIDTFYKRNILEAYEQLKMSEKEYQGQKPVIKIFLLYESMTNTQIVMSSIPEIFVDDSRCYIMTIEDLEMMLATCKNDKEKFERVVKALVTNQNSNVQVTSVLHVLNDCDAVGDMHFIEDRDYFMKIAKRMEKELEV